MRESWRWFGPGDPVTIEDIRQTGATDVVSALHDIPAGEVWAIEAIQEHKALIENAESNLEQLTWSVVVLPRHHRSTHTFRCQLSLLISSSETSTRCQPSLLASKFEEEPRHFAGAFLFVRQIL